MRKMLSLLLALLMTVTVVPVEAFAADLPTTFDITNDSQFASLKDYLAAGKNYYASGTSPITAGTDGKYSVTYNGSSLSVLLEPASGADASLFTTVWNDGTGEMSFDPNQPGTYTFAIKMNGETVAEGEVTIKKLSASNILWNGYETEKYWDGKAIPAPDVEFRFPNGTGADPDAVYWQKDGESEWHNFADGSVPSDAGTYHVKAEYSGSPIHNGAFETKTYIIHPNALAGVTLSAEEGVYTGSEQDPTHVVTTVHDLDFALVEGTHYTVSVTKDGQQALLQAQSLHRRGARAGKSHDLLFGSCVQCPIPLLPCVS